MTLSCEDPHDSWYNSILASSVQAARDHAGRPQFWLGTFAVLTVFWSAVAWTAWSVL